jgi:hypothetical protein
VLHRGVDVTAQAPAHEPDGGQREVERAAPVGRHVVAARAREVEPMPRAGFIAGAHVHARDRERHLGIAPALLVRHALQDRRERAQLALEQHPHPVVRGERPDVLPVAAGGRVLERLGRAAVRLEPAGGAPVQLGDLVGGPVTQLGPQQLGEQRVQPVPGAVVAGRREQRVVAREPREDARRVGPAGERVGEVGRGGVDDRDAEQVLADVRRLLGKDLGEQVVGHRAVVAREVGDERGRVRVRAHRQRRESQTGGPALGALPQRLGRLRVHRDVRCAEQLDGLREREGEVAAADLGELAGHAQPPDAQRWVHARGDHEAQRGRGMAEQPVEVAQRRRVADLVQVLEHEHDRLVEVLERVHESGEDQVRVLAGLDLELGYGPAQPGAPQRLEHAAPETAAVGVHRVERQPRGRAAARGGPLAEQRALAGARGSGHQRQRLAHPGVEPRAEPRAMHHRLGHVRRQELGRGQRDWILP